MTDLEDILVRTLTAAVAAMPSPLTSPVELERLAQRRRKRRRIGVGSAAVVAASVAAGFGYVGLSPRQEATSVAVGPNREANSGRYLTEAQLAQHGIVLEPPLGTPRVPKQSLLAQRGGQPVQYRDPRPAEYLLRTVTQTVYTTQFPVGGVDERIDHALAWVVITPDARMDPMGGYAGPSGRLPACRRGYVLQIVSAVSGRQLDQEAVC